MGGLFETLVGDGDHAASGISGTKILEISRLELSENEGVEASEEMKVYWIWRRILRTRLEKLVEDSGR